MTMATKSSADNKQTTGTQIADKIRKQTIQHEIKLELMRSCQIYRKSVNDTIKYFKSKGYSLSARNFTILNNELKSTKNAKDWFSKEALFVIEQDHMLSVDTIKMMENRLIQEFEQVSDTSFQEESESVTNEQITNKMNNSHLLLKIIAQFQSLQETKTKMFSATPLVQELMEVHTQQEEEEGENKQNQLEMKKTVTH